MSTVSNWVRRGLTLAGLALVSTAAIAADAPDKTKQPRSCFFINQWRGWKAPSDDVLYLSVNLHDVYKVQLSTKTPELQWPDAHLISRTRGPDTVCDALDLDLALADDNGYRQPLIATSLTKLTPEEVKAIPPKYRPY